MRGKYFFKQEPIQGLLPYQIFKKGIFRTFQITREFYKLTVLENLMIVQHPQTGENIWNTWFLFHKVKKEELQIKKKAMRVLEFVELIDHRNEYAGSLSGGQKKLLELAKSMMADPYLVLLDEPGAGVNPTLMNKLIEKIKALSKEKGMTFFLIEHDMDLVMNLCNPVIVMGGFIRKEQTGERISEIFCLFPVLKEKRYQKAKELPGGQRQMVAMGRALMLDPDILMLDEPSAGLAPRFVSMIFEKIRDINEKGVYFLSWIEYSPGVYRII